MCGLYLASQQNPLLYQWGLASAVVGLCVAAFGPIVFWLRMTLRRAKEGGPAPTTREVLQIKSVLADIFQKTVIQQACDIFQQIDDRLPVALSQSESNCPQTSVFDQLCARLRDVDPEDPDREQMRRILQDSLASIVSGQVRRFLASVNSVASSGRATTGQDTAEVQVSLGGEAERRLSFLATKIAQVNRNQRMFTRAGRWAHRLFSLSGCAGLAHIVFLFVDAQWGFWIAASLFLAFVVAGVLGGICIAIAYGCAEWIEHCAQRHKTAQDWDDELSQHQARR